MTVYSQVYFAEPYRIDRFWQTPLEVYYYLLYNPSKRRRLQWIITTYWSHRQQVPVQIYHHCTATIRVRKFSSFTNCFRTLVQVSVYTTSIFPYSSLKLTFISLHNLTNYARPRKQDDIRSQSTETLSYIDRSRCVKLTLFQPRVCSTRSPLCTRCEIPSNHLVQHPLLPSANKSSYLEDYKVGTLGWPKQTSPLNQYSVQG